MRIRSITGEYGITALFTLTIFVSSSMLFMVQPMFAKMVLPLLGGTPQVWNTCMVFFQAMLLLGYVYTHLSIRWLGVRQQIWLHAGVLVLPVFVLPIALGAGVIPSVDVYPATWLLGVLTMTVGLPFFVVSAYGPMLQRWFSELPHTHAHDPYFLYAASNAGSLIALLGYPFIIEPLLPLKAQSSLWSLLYGCLVVLSLLCAALILKHGKGAVTVTEAPTVSLDQSPVNWSRRLRWIALAFVPSSMMLGLTNYISTDIAAVPLLWVIPLSLYLLSFTLVFARRQFIPHAMVIRALPMAAMVLALLLVSHIVDPMPVMVAIHLLVFFIIAMVCHGELAKDRPPVFRLTEFYLLLSVGGVLGGIFNALISPLVFSDIYEYPIALFLALLLCPPLLKQEKISSYNYGLVFLPAAMVFGIDLILDPLLVLVGAGAPDLGPFRVPLVIILPLLVCYPMVTRPLPFAFALGGWFLASMVLFEQSKGEIVFAERSYFGIHEVSVTPSLGDVWVLRNGVTVHGVQQRDPALKRVPGTYYHPTGPAGQVMQSLQGMDGTVALIGLGAGSLASYAEQGDQLDIFEIDSVVVAVAEDARYFSYLSDARKRGARVEVYLGDARLEINKQPEDKYSLIVIDAFSSDAIPVHLATKEAVSLYLAKLKDNGVLLFHVSNHYLSLHPVLCNIADELGQLCYQQVNSVTTKQQLQEAKFYSHWVLMGKQEGLQKVLNSYWERMLRNDEYPVWSDDYSNILQILK